MAIPAGMTVLEYQKLWWSPAVEYFGPIKDIPPFIWAPGLAHARYTTFRIRYNCGGGRIGFGGDIGMPMRAGPAAEIKSRYHDAKDMIRKRVPAFETFIDIRTIEQLRVRCCPHLLYTDEMWKTAE